MVGNNPQVNKLLADLAISHPFFITPRTDEDTKEDTQMLSSWWGHQIAKEDRDVRVTKSLERSKAALAAVASSGEKKNHRVETNNVNSSRDEDSEQEVILSI